MNFQRILAQFVRLNLVVLVVLLILRASQWVSLSLLHTLPPDAWLLESHGFIQDAVLWLNISWLLLIPFFLLSLLRPWVGTVFFSLVFLLVALTEWSLFQYFKIVLTPLDQVVFSYTAREMIFIARSSAPLDILTFLPLFLIVIVTAVFIRVSQKVTMPRTIMILFFLLGISALFLRKTTTPAIGGYRNLFEYYLTTNKSAYFTEKYVKFRFNPGQTSNNDSVDAAAQRYHAAHPEFEFSGTRYPFLHADNTPDVLSPFFDLGKERPNLVFIIVESLSSCFMGNSSIFGSFTPFLDSLAQQGLYWNNCLSTADRTFNVLPAMFGSLPPGNPTFINDVSKIPYHLTMIRYLRENGYYASFFYAGDPAFNHMEDFLKRQEVDYILRSFGPKYRNVRTLIDGYHWGRSDGELFKRSLEVIDSIGRSPRLDIYLTLSLHSPFIPPNQAYYLAQVDNRLKSLVPGTRLRTDIENYKNIFATILYTDHALKEFFNNYKKQPGYSNTIFIITGDHGLPELNLYRFSGLARFNVPLIIYSPMVKKGVMMRSVSSHLDVTPSFLAMMRAKYQVKTRIVAPWLGSGLDTTTAFRNVHSLPFILNNKEIIEYISKTDFIFRDQLYKVFPELSLKDTTDIATERKMSRELADFKILNTYVTRQNRLISPEIYFGKVIDSVDVVIEKPVLFNPIDPPGEFRNFFDKVALDPKIKFVKLEIMVDIQTPEADPAKFPEAVFDLYGENGKHLLFDLLRFTSLKDKPTKPGEWQTYYIRDFVELSYLRNADTCSLLLYIWNRTGSAVAYDNQKVKITGYY